MSKAADSNNHVLITGASGLIGSSLVPFLQAQGYIVHTLQRTPDPTLPYWNIEKQQIQLNGCPTPNIIIHLAGENIAKSRWTIKSKEKITNSRIQSTQLLVDFINNSKTPPALFICASAIGFYGDRGQQPVDEGTSKGKDFVSELAEKWELTCQQVRSPKTRIVNLRTGIVLNKTEGALAKMLPAFKMGLGGRIGTGKQVMSWIDLKDELNAILFIIKQSNLTGPVNLVSPHPVNNKTFSIMLANILKRPCILPLPESIIKFLFGQMGKELLLSSTNVRPTKLLKAGFKFEYELLEESLKHQLR